MRRFVNEAGCLCLKSYRKGLGESRAEPVVTPVFLCDVCILDVTERTQSLECQRFTAAALGCDSAHIFPGRGGWGQEWDCEDVEKMVKAVSR